MSGIFGIFNRNGKPVESETIQKIQKSMSYWNPDASRTWNDRMVSLGHEMLWNTPESKFEHLPNEKNGLVITMDARLDNREELAKKLGMEDKPLGQITDSDFILEAYKEWGEESPKYLLGDFAYAIWDSTKEQLFCARDHIGIKLFHFYLSKDLFVFGNDIEGVLAHSDVSRKLNDNTVATYLKDEGIHTRRETFFEKIYKLPSATSLTVTSSDIVENEYWRIENSPLVHYDSFQEYVEQLKKLLEDAVEARLRTAFPVASHLTGGIDSSPIAVLAARKLKNKNKILYAFNWINIPDNSEEYEFESWNFSRRIAEQETNIDHKEFKIDPHYMVKQYENHNILTKGTMQYWEEYYVQDMVNKTNARTMLSGWGGNELISFNGYSYIAGLFSKGKIRQAVKCLLEEKKYLNYTWIKFSKRMLTQILPHKMIRYLTRKKNPNHQQDYYKFLTQEFMTFMLEHKNKEFTNVVGVRKRQIYLYNYGHIQDRIESWALSSFSKRFEYSYPLLDKRIVEFAIGIPEEVFYPQKAKERPLIKHAVKNLLPSDIIWTTKVSEVKINRSLKKSYSDSFKILKEKYDNKNCKNYKNKYVDCDKVIESLKTFDSEKSPTFEWGNITPSINLLNTLKNHGNNNNDF